MAGVGNIGWSGEVTGADNCGSMPIEVAGNCDGGRLAQIAGAVNGCRPAEVVGAITGGRMNL